MLRMALPGRSPGQLEARAMVILLQEAQARITLATRKRPCRGRDGPGPSDSESAYDAKRGMPLNTTPHGIPPGPTGRLLHSH